MIPDYTLVCGVDAKHLKQLAMVYPTWIKHKPSLLEHPMIVFHDDSVTWAQISKILHPSTKDLRVVSWPFENVEYEGDPTNKFLDPHRYKMLAGFVHVPADHVKTKYWLKIDVDTIASGNDYWIEESWFDNEPAIISHPWGFTKPPNQMVLLDEWTGAHLDKLPNWVWQRPPLNLIPKPGASRVSHKRIISWCAFFNTEFTKVCSEVANEICGEGKLPVPSQDGYLWYMAERGGFGIVRANMKSRGWIHRGTMRGIQSAVEESMK